MKFSASPSTSMGDRPSRLDRAGLVGDRVAGARQRLAAAAPRRNICGVCAAHLSRAVDGGCDAAVALGLQRVGHRQRQQAADLVVEAGVDQPVDPLRVAAGQRAASCTSTQSSSRAPRSRSDANPLATVAARVAPPRARPPAARAGEFRHFALELRVVVGQHHQRRLQSAAPAPTRAACGPPARARPMRAYCLGPLVPARSPTPAQGTNAKQRGPGGVSVVVIAAILESQPSAMLRSRGEPPVNQHCRDRHPIPLHATCRASLPANASCCRCRPARPTRCCSRARPRHARPRARCTAILDRRSGRCAAPGRRVAVLLARRCAWRCSPIGRRCPTTPSRRTRTWCPNGWPRCGACCSATSTWCCCRPPPR